MLDLFKKYGFLLHILIVVFVYFVFLTDIRYELSRVSLSLGSFPYFLGLAYWIAGILSFKGSLEKKKKHHKSLFYIIIGFLIFGVSS